MFQNSKGKTILSKNEFDDDEIDYDDYNHNDASDDDCADTNWDKGSDDSTFQGLTVTTDEGGKVTILNSKCLLLKRMLLDISLLYFGAPEKQYILYSISRRVQPLCFGQIPINPKHL